jgi:hypothetical protein
MNGVSYLALAVGLLTKTSFAFGQTLSPTLVAQLTGSVPPSGVLITPQPAPVVVPSSGVLATVERHAVTTFPLKLQTTKRATLGTMRRHVVHWRLAVRRETTTGTTTEQPSIAATPWVVGGAAEQPRHDGIGYEIFLSSLGKGKETKFDKLGRKAAPGRVVEAPRDQR